MRYLQMYLIRLLACEAWLSLYIYWLWRLQFALHGALGFQGYRAMAPRCFGDHKRRIRRWPPALPDMVWSLMSWADPLTGMIEPGEAHTDRCERGMYAQSDWLAVSASAHELVDA